MEKALSEFSCFQEIARGTFSTVYRAIHVHTGLEVAIKAVFKNYSQNNTMQMTYQEISIMKSLDHPYIAHLYQVVETKECIYLIMEYVGSVTLLQLINRGGLADEDVIKKIFMQLASAIKYLHSKKICHHDLKIENIVIGRGTIVKLIDFGFASCTENSSSEYNNCGTISYSAPELFLRTGCSESVDIWALGIVLYVMISGKLPFTDDNPNQLIHKIVTTDYPVLHVSASLNDLLCNMLCKDPNHRYQIDKVILHEWVQLHKPYFKRYISYGENPCNRVNISNINQLDHLILKRLSDIYQVELNEITKSINLSLSNKIGISYKILRCQAINEGVYKFVERKYISLNTYSKSESKILNSISRQSRLISATTLGLGIPYIKSSRRVIYPTPLAISSPLNSIIKNQ